LKIEGRLKDLAYVKNITAYYRKELDKIFEKRPEYAAASSGETLPYFLPDPQKSFNRGFTHYFLHGRNKEIASPETPKSLGEPVGQVQDLDARFFTIKGAKSIHNGDGLCFINERKELQGFRVNRTEGNKIFPAEMPRMVSGIALFRNQDHEFEKVLAKKSAERKINVDVILEENHFGFSLTLIDEDTFSACITVESAKELANKDQKANIKEQLSKLGNTPFRLSHFSDKLEENWFIPSSLLSEMRRKAVEALLSVRKIAFPRPIKKIQPTNHPYSETSLTYLGNVSNEKAQAFYLQHEVKKIDPAFELEQPEAVAVMTMKHCLRYQLGYCPKTKENNRSLNEPWMLLTGRNRLKLRFDCANCEMQVITD
jgi:putative protease